MAPPAGHYKGIPSQENLFNDNDNSSWKCGVKLLKFSEWDKSFHGVVTIPSSQALLELRH
ncbi:hypothetical protein P5673_017278 [Acropora cervicornis]|uniref:Uncharacterized protein n=1 Tax=Acropora cervicornis TaxID=6130 RepID=A0AAD9V3U8_ACRCE|nr:hypothetical protein P5673_017278 [Acropora cervicornis]